MRQTRLAALLMMGLTGCADPDATSSRSETAIEVAFETEVEHEAQTEVEPEHETEVDSGACHNGTPCNDFDSCTVDDVCTNGVCVGSPLRCDDQIACTLDTCSGGVCHHEVALGFCRLDGHCYSDGQANPDNACERCESAASRGAWTSQDGRKCNDGDACTDGESCLAGLCQGGVAITTGACEVDPPDPLDPVCTTHFDCYPDQLCARWPTDAALHCSPPCASDATCAADETCVKVPGSANVAVCTPASPIAHAAGNACVLDSECASGICVAQTCRAACVGEAGCTAADSTCRPVGDIATGIATSACIPNVGTLQPLAALCTADGEPSPNDDYNIHYCASGHCDLVPYGISQAPLVCAPLCQADRDCAAGQECGVVRYGEAAAPGNVPFHPQFTTPTRSAVTACYTRQAVAASHLPGTPCDEPTECASNKCLHLIPGDDQRYCSAYCATSADCPSGMHCKPDTITLASDWLQTPWINAQPPTTSAWTIARVCKFE